MNIHPLDYQSASACSHIDFCFVCTLLLTVIYLTNLKVSPKLGHLIAVTLRFLRILVTLDI